MSTTLTGRRVLVTDAHTTAALAIVRSLAAAGMAVTVVREPDRFCLAAASRYVSRVVSLPAVESHPEQHREGLLQELAARPYDVLIPVTDSTIALIRTCRDRFEALVRVAAPHECALAGAQDKRLTIERARDVGVRCPPTLVFASVEEAHAAAEGLRYPCVIKPRFSRQWAGRGPMVRGAVEYAYSPASLRQVFATTSLDPSSLLVQEFVEGDGVGVFALMNAGAPVALFAHRRLREANPTGGRASLAVSIAPEPRVIEPALRLLRALDWTGVAMVEFKDPGASEAPVVMEVNGRFWGSLPLAIAAGVDFPVLLVRQMLGVPAVVPEGYRIGVRCRHLKGDLSHLIATLKGRPRGWRGPYPGRVATLAAIAPWPGRWRPFNFRLSDPAPAIGEAFDVVRDTARSALGRSERTRVAGAAAHP